MLYLAANFKFNAVYYRYFSNDMSITSTSKMSYIYFDSSFLSKAAEQITIFFCYSNIFASIHDALKQPDNRAGRQWQFHLM
jgi:hypothetical protein